MLQKLTFNPKKEEGFTLVELLIVVAIIAILAAIAIPQFSAYRKRGYVATVNSDAKNVFTAAQAYLVDNPSATVTCANTLTSGYTASADVTCGGTMSVSTGSFTLTGSTNWGLTDNTAEISYLGVLTKATP